MKTSFFFIFVLFIILPSVAQISKTERDALITFYQATNGDEWVNNTNWNTETPVSTWFGVSLIKIDGIDFVSSINLYNNNLIGYIPSGLAVLKELSLLNLPKNKLDPNIPDALKANKGLRTINLYGNISNQRNPSEIVKEKVSIPTKKVKEPKDIVVEEATTESKTTAPSTFIADGEDKEPETKLEKVASHSIEPAKEEPIPLEKIVAIKQEKVNPEKPKEGSLALFDNNKALKEIQSYANRIYFNSNQTDFVTGVPQRLDAIASIMKKNPTSKYTITGHTDKLEHKPGLLSKERAEAIKAYLLHKGIDGTRLRTIGKTGTAAADDSSKGRRAKNRGIEITLNK